MKSERQNRILELVAQYEIETQEEMMERLRAEGYMKNTNPSFYYRHYHSQHYWWDNELNKEFRTRIGGSLSIDRWRTRLYAGVENIKNYTYLANTSVPVTNSSGDITGFKNNASVLQHSGNIQVFTKSLKVYAS